MAFFLQKIKFNNFLSFLGEQEIQLKPSSIVFCQYPEGKDHFFKGIQFVFNSKLSDLSVTDALHLVHKTLYQDPGNDVECYVEATIYFPNQKKTVQLTRFMKNGRIGYKISDVYVSVTEYQNKLTSLGLDAGANNIMFLKKDFDTVLWGTEDDLEELLSKRLGKRFVKEPLEEMNKNLSRLETAKKCFAKTNFASAKKDHLVLEELVQEYEAISSKLEPLREKDSQQPPDSPEPAEAPAEGSPRGIEPADAPEPAETANRVQVFETVEAAYVEEYRALRELQEIHSSRLHYMETRIALESGDPKILQNRVAKLRKQLELEDDQFPSHWTRIQESVRKLESISSMISSGLGDLHDFQQTRNLATNLTPYGRFKDYLLDEKYWPILKRVLGTQLFHGNLVDDRQEAVDCISLLKSRNCDQRETFVAFEEYSPLFKDTILADGGIRLETIEDVVGFLLVLKKLKVISRVPIFAGGSFPFNIDKAVETKNDVFYYETEEGYYVTDEGIISCVFNEEKASGEEEGMEQERGDSDEERQVTQSLDELITAQEMVVHNLNDLYFAHCEAKFRIRALEDDISFLKTQIKKCVQTKKFTENLPLKLSEIYEPYADIFAECDAAWELATAPQEPFECPTPEERQETVEPQVSEEDDLGAREVEINNVSKKLRSVKKKLRLLCLSPVYNKPKKSYVPQVTLRNKEKYCYRMQLEAILEIISKEDLDYFTSWKDWRLQTLNSVIRDKREIENEIARCKKDRIGLLRTRDDNLLPFINHCNSSKLHGTFNDILNGALPELKLVKNSDTGLRLTTRLFNGGMNRDVKDWNRFIVFASALSLFMEIAGFNKTPFLILEDLDEYFPRIDKCAFPENAFEDILSGDVETHRFQLIMKVAQYLVNLVAKNSQYSSAQFEARKQDNVPGPMQVIQFATADTLSPGRQVVFIKEQMLPDDLLGICEECTTFSKLYDTIFSNGWYR